MTQRRGRTLRIGRWFVPVALSCVLSFTSCREDALAPFTAELDRAIAAKPQYDAEKERRIEKLRSLREVEGLTPRQEYGINERLYAEFKKYKLDSAIRYIERNLRLGLQMDSQRCIVHSKLRLARLYSSTGRSIEAQRLLDSVDRRTVPPQLLHAYYRAVYLCYLHYGALSNQQKHYPLLERYADSMLLAGDPSSVRYKLTFASTINDGSVGRDSVESYLCRLFEEIGPDDPRHAEIAHQLSGFYRSHGEKELSRKYEMLSAITDARHSIKENTSFQSLARDYYHEGDLERAFKYTNAAFEDALFSNVQFRATEISELYSVISASLREREAATKQRLQSYLVLLVALSATLVALFVFTYRQARSLNRIRRELSLTNDKLTRFNEELIETNERLFDANAVKVQYIARFFDICSIYIDKMDDYRKTLKKLADSRKYDLLSRQLKSTSMLEKEQHELFRKFDVIFLTLYPSFVEEFNALLCEEERIVPRADHLLNRELRIYALLRLGIADNARIASFLRCSLSTVYNYRTRMRNRALVPRDEFERRVMKIGLIRHAES